MLIMLLIAFPVLSIIYAIKHHVHGQSLNLNQKGLLLIYDYNDIEGITLFAKLELVIIGTLSQWKSLRVAYPLLVIVTALSYGLEYFVLFFSNCSALFIIYLLDRRYKEEIKESIDIIAEYRTQCELVNFRQLLCLVASFRLIDATELFWSKYNKATTATTTRLFYQVVGGSENALMATILTFLYSAIVLHLLFSCVVIEEGLFLSFLLFYSSNGIIIGINKHIRQKSRKKTTQ